MASLRAPVHHLERTAIGTPVWMLDTFSGADLSGWRFLSPYADASSAKSLPGSQQGEKNSSG